MEAFCKSTGISFQISIDLPIKNIPIKTNIFEINEVLRILKNIPLEKIEKEVKAGFILLILQELHILSTEDKTSIRNKNLFLQSVLTDEQIKLIIRIYERKYPKNKLPQISFENNPFFSDFLETLQQMCWPPNKKEIFEITDLVIKPAIKRRRNINEEIKETEISEFFSQERTTKTLKEVLAERAERKLQK